mgnify:FL=1
MTKSIKISSELYRKLKQLAKDENRFIGSLLDKAVENYLRAKKILPLICMTNKE